MKQLLQSLSSGFTELQDIPSPVVLPGHLLVRTTTSLVSPGTERMLVNFGRSSLLHKALQQPDKVQQVVNKARTDGVLPTLNAVKTKLDQPLPLGYCNVGKVVMFDAE